MMGDADVDRAVTLDDFNTLAGHFGESAGATGPSTRNWADLGAAVPEPAGVALLGCVMLTVARRRPRKVA